MVTIPVSEPQTSETITEYVVVAEGVATGFEIEGLLKPTEGLQAKLVPPLTRSVVDSPIQTPLDAAETEALAPEFTVIAMLVVSEPQPLETITVYVVFALGLATGFANVVLLKPIGGLQEYALPPPARSVVEPPQGTDVEDAVTEAVVIVDTLIVMLVVSVPHCPDAITEYVVVTVGPATGLAMVVLLRPVEGLQIKFVPPVH